MELSDFKKHKRAMEHAIRAAASDAVERFTTLTGHSPHSITIHLHPVETLGAEIRYVVGSVETDVDL